jgi:hypothetical protein
MFGTSTKTTWQIRNATRELILSLGRPASILEIKDFILRSKPELWKKVTAKSLDYVRVTLGTTPAGHFTKFECPGDFMLTSGERSKKLFWGLSGLDYGEAWRPSPSSSSSVQDCSSDIGECSGGAGCVGFGWGLPAFGGVCGGGDAPFVVSGARVGVPSLVEVGIQARPSSIDLAHVRPSACALSSGSSSAIGGEGEKAPGAGYVESKPDGLWDGFDDFLVESPTCGWEMNWW